MPEPPGSRCSTWNIEPEQPDRDGTGGDEDRDGLGKKRGPVATHRPMDDSRNNLTCRAATATPEPPGSRCSTWNIREPDHDGTGGGDEDRDGTGERCGRVAAHRPMDDSRNSLTCRAATATPEPPASTCSTWNIREPEQPDRDGTGGGDEDRDGTGQRGAAALPRTDR